MGFSGTFCTLALGLPEGLVLPWHQPLPVTSGQRAGGCVWTWALPNTTCLPGLQVGRSRTEPRAHTGGSVAPHLSHPCASSAGLWLLLCSPAMGLLFCLPACQIPPQGRAPLPKTVWEMVQAVLAALGKLNDSRMVGLGSTTVNSGLEHVCLFLGCECVSSPRGLFSSYLVQFWVNHLKERHLLMDGRCLLFRESPSMGGCRA